MVKIVSSCDQYLHLRCLYFVLYVPQTRGEVQHTALDPVSRHDDKFIANSTEKPRSFVLFWCLRRAANIVISRTATRRTGWLKTIADLFGDIDETGLWLAKTARDLY